MDKKWILRLGFFGMTLCFTACGGGGGGGGNSSPDRSDNGPEPIPEELQSGLFTDAPVTGLRFTQGTRQGYTDEGRFAYDANSSEPVCFYIDELQLGCAAGETVVTPFDLFSPGQPAGLQSGYNISRLLVSLDQSSDADIVLPAQGKNIQGSINFSLADGEFATDIVVKDLVERYAPAGALVSRQDVDAHIANNADVQQAISDLNAELNERVSSIQIQWNSTLNDVGVLAQVEAKPLDSSQKSEHVYLEVDPSEAGLYLSRVTHVDSQGNFTYLTLDEEGLPLKVSDGVKTYSYINVLNTELADIVATSSYQPTRKGVLVGNGGLSDSQDTSYIQEQKAAEIVDAMARLSSAEFTEDDLLRVASHATSYVKAVACYDSSGSCHAYMQDALLLAEIDPVYAERVIGWEATVLSPRLCLTSAFPGVENSESCSMAPNLAEFNLVMSQRMATYVGAVKFPVLVNSVNAAATARMMDRIGDVAVFYNVWCTADVDFYSFADDTYYVSSRSGLCQSIPEIYWGQVSVFQCSPPPYDVITEACEGFVDFQDWPAFEHKRDLALTMVNRLLSNGIGQTLVSSSAVGWEEEYYLDVGYINAIINISDLSALKWLNALSVDTSNEEYFVAGPLDSPAMSFAPIPFGSVFYADDTMFAGHGLAASFLHKDGTEVNFELFLGGTVQ